MKIKKMISALCFLCFLGLLGGLYAFTTNEISTRFGPDQPEWKNLKVLPKDITKDSLMGLMHGYERSLGVRCSFCHAPRKDNPRKLDFPSDAKFQKEIARGMIKMTNDINANYFLPHFPDPKPDQVTVVKCIMCHRGNRNPQRYLQNVGTLYKKPKHDRKGGH